MEIDASTGLLSTLSCPVRELIAVTERSAPNMECYFHGNLPAQGSPFADDVEVESEATVAQIKKKRPPTATSSIEFRHYGSTRVDVDSRGRQTLVNDMR